MTRNQKLLVLALGAVNFICFCIAAPAVLLISNLVGAPQSVPPTSTRAAFVRLPTSTEAPSPTPQATYTLVLPPRATITPRALEAGWKFYEMRSEGFGIALPPNWDKVDFDPIKLEEFRQTLMARNPDLAAALTQTKSQFGSGNMAFFGFDLSPESLGSGFLTNLNILRESVTFALPLDSIVQLNLQNLEKRADVSKPITRKRVKLVTGDAEQIQYSFSITTSERKILFSVTQFLAIHEKSVYVLTFGTSPDKEKKYAPIFLKTAQSLQWLP